MEIMQWISNEFNRDILNSISNYREINRNRSRSIPALILPIARKLKVFFYGILNVKTVTVGSERHLEAS